MIDHHAGVTSKRIDLTIGQALQAIGDHDPFASRDLLAADACFVAGFDRKADNGEKWQVFIFATCDGTHCITLCEEVGGYDITQDCYDDDFTRVAVERTDAYGDAWGECSSYGMFPLPSGQIISGA